MIVQNKPIKLANRQIYPKSLVFVMGILNCTPDSFFAESRKIEPLKAVEKALQMVENGADIIDIGAESSRPGVNYIEEAEEINRLIPVITELRKKTNCPISVDTRRKNVFKEAFYAGADILNDISALEDDKELALFAAKENVPVILMHKRGNPAEMMTKTCYNDVVAEVKSYLLSRVDYANEMGIKDESIILDPGVGFSKKLQENLCISKNINEFSFDGKYHVLLGASRKTCVGELTGKTVEKRLAGSLAFHLLGIQNGASIVRVHDVEEMVDCVNVLKGFLNDIV